MKRIISALLVLLLIVSALPVDAGAVEYQIGDTIWTNGPQPTEETVKNSRWIPVIKGDNVQEYRTTASGTNEYQWIVEAYYGPGEKEGIPTSFTVMNVDPEGNPLPETEFVLFEIREDDLFLVASAKTDENGKAEFQDLCLEKGCDSSVWYLAQTNFNDNPLSELYHPYVGQWEVYITRNENGEHSLEILPAAMQLMSIRGEETTEETGITDNYDSTTSVLTLVNQPINIRLDIQVLFENGVIPEDITSCPVTVVFPRGTEIPMDLQLPEDGGTVMSDTLVGTLKPGVFTIKVDEEAMQQPGYTLYTTCSIARVGEDPVETNEVTLTKEKPAASITITHQYVEKGGKNTIIVQAQDENKKALKGAEFQLLDAAGAVAATYSGDSGNVIIDLTDKAEDGKTLTYSLVQSKSPNGYTKSEYAFDVTVKKSGEKTTIKAQRATNPILRLFRSGKDEGPNGEQIVVFPSDMIPSTLTVNMAFAGAVNALDTVTLKLADQNNQYIRTLSEGNNWQTKLENIPMSRYTITQEVEIDGYRLSSTYHAQGGIVTDGETEDSIQLTTENAELAITNELVTDERVYIDILDQSDDYVVGTAEDCSVFGLFLSGKDPAYTLTDGPSAVENNYSDGTPDGKIVFVLQDLIRNYADQMPDGLKLTLVMRQIKAPAGYVCSTDEFEISVEKKDGIINHNITYLGIPVTGRMTFRNTKILATPDAVILQTKDQDGKPLGGAEYSLVDKEGNICWEGKDDDQDGTITVEELEELVQNHEDQITEEETTLYLKQTGNPDGYKLSITEYEVLVKKVGNSILGEIPEAEETEDGLLLVFQNEKEQSSSELPEPPGPNDTSKRVVIETRDSKGTLLRGAEYALVDSTETIVFWESADDDRDGKIIIENQEDLIANQSDIITEQRTQLKLVQTKSPDKYVLSSTTFSVTAQKEGDVICCEILGGEETADGLKLIFRNEAEPDDMEPDDSTPSNPAVVTDASNVIIIRTMNDKGEELGGAKYSLYYGSAAIRSYTDYGTGYIKIEDTEMLLGPYTDTSSIFGTPLTLKQVSPPNGATLSDKTYTVELTKSGNKIKVNVLGSEIDTSKAQLVDFIHKSVVQKPAQEEEEDTVIVIRTVDQEGDPLNGAEYCLSEDLHYDKKKDIRYDDADEKGEIIIDDLADHVEEGKSISYYLMQSRQPENGSLSAQRFKVDLKKRNGKLDVKVSEDKGVLESVFGDDSLEQKDNEWIVTFTSDPTHTVISLSYKEEVNWNDCEENEELLASYHKDAYDFILHWEYEGEEQKDQKLKLSGGEAGTFEPIPYGSLYKIEAVRNGCYKTEITKGAASDIASARNIELEATISYNFLKVDNLVLDMMRVDAETDASVEGATFELKADTTESVTTYRTGKYGEFVVDTINTPGTYTLTETYVPDGFVKIKKPISIDVAVGYEEGEDENGDPAILQVLMTQINHSNVKQDLNGIYRIGVSDDKGDANLMMILGIGLVALGGAATATGLLLRRRKNKMAK